MVTVLVCKYIGLMGIDVGYVSYINLSPLVIGPYALKLVTTRVHVIFKGSLTSLLYVREI